MASPDKLVLETAVKGDVAVISARGDLDAFTTHEFRVASQDVLARDFRFVILDITEVEFIDSAALGAMVGLSKKLTARSGWLRVVSTDHRINKTLAVTGLFRVFAIYPSVSGAISYDRPGRPRRRDVPEGADDVRSWVGKDPIRAQAALNVEYLKPKEERRSDLISELWLIVARTPSPGIPLRIYLDEETGNEEVESAVRGVADAFGFAVLYDLPPIIASWFKELFIRAKKTVEKNTSEEHLDELARALRIKAVDQQQAQVDSVQADAVSKLLVALEGRQNALIQIGSVLLIIADGVPFVRNLTQLELIHYERNPALFRDPSRALQELQRATSGELLEVNGTALDKAADRNLTTSQDGER